MYQFGQFLGNGANDNYLTPEEVNVVDFTASLQNDIYQGNQIIFTNKVINTEFGSGNYYYLNFKIRTDDSSQTFYLKLQNVNDTRVEKEQFIKTIVVPQDPEKVYISFEAIIAPNSTYNQLIWELQRTREDYTVHEGEDQINGRKTFDKVESFGTVINKINSSITPLAKIGIQGPPSLLMCINGEQIRIGKSGIYEINNSIPITFVGFIPKENDYFIVDYEYGEED